MSTTFTDIKILKQKIFNDVDNAPAGRLVFEYSIIQTSDMPLNEIIRMEKDLKQNPTLESVGIDYNVEGSVDKLFVVAIKMTNEELEQKKNQKKVRVDKLLNEDENSIRNARLLQLIEDEVSKVVNTQDDPIREPENPRMQRPVYRPVLKTEDEVDEILFYAGNKPKEE